MGQLWSLPGGRPIGVAMAHQADVALATISTDGTFLATAQTNGLVRVWRHRSAIPRTTGCLTFPATWR